jgi:hypothetical protein
MMSFLNLNITYLLLTEDKVNIEYPSTDNWLFSCLPRGEQLLENPEHYGFQIAQLYESARRLRNPIGRCGVCLYTAASICFFYYNPKKPKYQLIIALPKCIDK